MDTTFQIQTHNTYDFKQIFFNLVRVETFTGFVDIFRH